MDKPDIVDVLNNPEPYYPHNFETAEKANALYAWLCQLAAEEITKLRKHKWLELTDEEKTSKYLQTIGVKP